MKEATGEVSMTMVTIVAIAVIGGILAFMWEPITSYIKNAFGNTGQSTCESAGGIWHGDATNGYCTHGTENVK